MLVYFIASQVLFWIGVVLTLLITIATIYSIMSDDKKLEVDSETVIVAFLLIALFFGAAALAKFIAM